MTQKLRSFVPIFTLASLLLSSAEVAAQEEALDSLAKTLSARPTIAEVQRAAIAEAELEARRDRRLIRRIRAASILPRVDATLSRGNSLDEYLDREHGELDELRITTDQDLQLRVVLHWDLAQLVYDSEELRARREANYREQRRQEIITNVTRLYFELRTLRIRRELDRRLDDASFDVEREMRIAELHALLDGLTGGRLDWDL
jgi:hypothetical protein